MARSSILLIILVLGVAGTQGIPKGDSNLNVNTNRFSRRNLNTNLNSNSFVRGKNGKGDDTYVDGDFDGESRGRATCKAEKVRQAIGLTTTVRPPRNQPRAGSPSGDDSIIARAIQDIMGDRPGKKVANINSNTNTFGSSRNGKLSRQGMPDPHDFGLPTMAPHMARDPHKNSNFNSNTNQMRRSKGSGPKIPFGGGQYNINSNMNQFRGSGSGGMGTPDFASRRSNSANVNTNSNMFRRSNNRNVNSNSNYYRGFDK